MASVFSTPGPIHHYVRWRGTSPFVYLGTAEVSPLVDGDPSYLPVFNDMKSRTKPMQLVYDGESHSLTTNLNRFDYDVWSRARDPQSHSPLAADHGIDSAIEIGSLVMGIGDFELVLVHGFWGTAAATPGLRRGRLYHSVTVGNYQENSAGTRVLSVAVRFDAQSLRDAATGEFRLFSEAIDGLTFPAVS